MSRKRRKKKLELSEAPTLLTDVRNVGWRNGLLMLAIESGPTKGTFALAPHMVLVLQESMRRARATSGAAKRLTSELALTSALPKRECHLWKNVSKTDSARITPAPDVRVRNYREVRRGVCALDKSSAQRTCSKG